MRILHCIGTVDPASGGPVEGLRQMAAVNRRRGHEIDVVSLDSPESAWLRSFPLTVHALGGSDTWLGYAPRLVPWLRANASRYNCVIVNGIWGYNSYGVWLALKGSDFPYYVYTHGMLDPWFKYRYPLKHFKKWLVWPWAVYPVLRDARAVLFTTVEERDLARQSFWLYDCNEAVVSYGTAGIPDPARDYASAFLNRHPALHGKRRFVFLGRVHPKKGADLLIAAIARLQGEGAWNASRACLIMAGPHDGEYARGLKSLAHRLGVSDSLVWPGMLGGDDKWGALQCAEAFVLPSHQENFGIAVAEALSAGVPVLISRSVNIWREVVGYGAGLAAPDSVAGCTAMLRGWLRLDADERARYAAAARRCFEDCFTVEKAAASLLSTIMLTVLPAPGDSLRSAPMAAGIPATPVG